MLKKLFGPAVIYGLAGQVGMMVNFFVLPVTTPHLTAEDFGIFGIIAGYAAAVSVLQTLGLNVIFSNVYYKHPTRFKTVYRSGLGILHLWSFGYCILLGGLLYLTLPDAAEPYSSLVLAAYCLPPLLLGAPDGLGQLLMQLRRRPTVILWGTLLAGVIGGAANIYTIVELGWGWRGMVITVGLSTLVIKLFYTVINYFIEDVYPIFRFNVASWKARFRVSLPVMPHYYSTYLLNSSDRIVMDQLALPVSEIGEYSVVGRFGALTGAGVTALNKAVAPLILSCYKKQNYREAKRLWEIVQIALLCGTAVLCLFMPEVFPLIFKNPDLLSVIPLTVPVIMAYNYRGMYIASSSLLFYTEKTAVLWRISFAAGLLNVVSNFILIPYFGIMAAAWTTWGAFMYMGYSGFFLKDRREAMRGHEDVNWKMWFGLTTIFTLAAFWAINEPLVVRVITCALLFSLLAWPIRRILRKPVGND